MKRLNSGFMLIEVLLALAVMVSFTALVATQVNDASKESRINAAVDEFATLQERLRQQWFPGHNYSYSSLSNNGLISSGLLPDSMQSSVAGKIKSSLGSEVNVYPWGTGNMAYQLKLYPVPKWQCEKFVYVTYRSTGRVIINGTTVSGGGIDPNSVTYKKIADACTANVGNTVNIINT